MRPLLITAVILLCLVSPSFGQDDEQPVVLPDAVMKQVVSRMARWYFKPRSKVTTVYFSDENVRLEWFPKIKGIRFVLLNGSEYNGEKKGYTFGDIYREGKGYTIGFGYGDIGCSGGGSGVTWKVYVDKSRVRLFPKPDYRWGWNCDADPNPN